MAIGWINGRTPPMTSATTTNPRSIQRHQLRTVTFLVITHFGVDGFSIAPQARSDEQGPGPPRTVADCVHAAKAALAQRPMA